MSTVPTTSTSTTTFSRLRPTVGLVRASLRLNARRFGWSLALVLLTGAEWLTVPFWSDPVASNDWDALLRLDAHIENAAVVLLTLPTVIAVAAAIGQRRSLTSRNRAVLWTQSVTPARWFLARFGILTASVVLLGIGTMTVLGCASAHWTVDHGLLADTDHHAALLLLVGPATVALALSGLAVGVLAGALLRNAWIAATAGGVTAALLTWLNALATDTRGPLRLTRDGSHTLITGVSASGYWLQQLLHTTVLLGLTTLAVLATVRLLRRRS